VSASALAQRERLFLDFVKWGFDERGWSKDTRSNYRLRVKVADEWLRENLNKSVTAANARSLRDYIFQTVPNPRNRNHIRQALMAFYDFLVAQGYRDDNPARGLPRLRTPKLLPKAITTDEARRVLRAAKVFGPRAEAMIAVLFYTGMRRKEVLNLEWSSIDGEWIRFFATKNQTEREIPLHPEASLALAKWRANSSGAWYVFPSPRNPNRPISTSSLAQTLREVGYMAGVHLHPHLCRHTCATHLLEKGVELRTLQEWLGHASPATTAIYTRVRRPMLADARDAFD
jgi:integrase/recombinase XerD